MGESREPNRSTVIRSDTECCTIAIGVSLFISDDERVVKARKDDRESNFTPDRSQQDVLRMSFSVGLYCVDVYAVVCVLCAVCCCCGCVCAVK